MQLQCHALALFDLAHLGPFRRASDSNSRVQYPSYINLDIMSFQTRCYSTEHAVTSLIYSAAARTIRFGPTRPILAGMLQSTPLRIRHPRRIPDWFTLSGTPARIPSLGYVRVSSAGTCAMPCPRWAHMYAHHARASDSPCAREIARVGSDTKCNASDPAHGLGPLYRGVSPTYVATRLCFRPRFAQNG
jgi:hypothetical protein